MSPSNVSTAMVYTIWIVYAFSIKVYSDELWMFKIRIIFFFHVGTVFRWIKFERHFDTYTEESCLTRMLSVILFGLLKIHIYEKKKVEPKSIVFSKHKFSLMSSKS